MQRAWSLLKWLHSVELLGKKVLLSRDAISTLGSPDTSFKIKTPLQRAWGALPGLLEESFPRDKLAEFPTALSHSGETPAPRQDSLASYVQQSFFRATAFLTPPGFPRGRQAAKVPSAKALLSSACHPAEVIQEDLSLCWSHPGAQEAEDCRNQ